MSGPLNTRHAVYVGSFDPITLGHLDIIRRGAHVFERVIVGIGLNPDKTPLFSPEERVELTRETVKSMSNVDVRCFEGLAVNFARSCGAGVMLRGMRTLTDIESELTMSLANRTLAPDIETVFLMASDKYSHISSSLIKQIAQMGCGGTEELKDFVPRTVIEPLFKRYQPGAK